MGRIYTVQTNAVAVTAAQDFAEILAPTDSVVKIHDWVVMQTSDVGDAAEEILRIETVRGVGAVTSGSDGTTPTAQPISDGDTAFGGTVERNNMVGTCVSSSKRYTRRRHVRRYHRVMGGRCSCHPPRLIR